MPVMQPLASILFTLTQELAMKTTIFHFIAGTLGSLIIFLLFTKRSGDKGFSAPFFVIFVGIVCALTASLISPWITAILIAGYALLCTIEFINNHTNISEKIFNLKNSNKPLPKTARKKIMKTKTIYIVLGSLIFSWLFLYTNGIGHICRIFYAGKSFALEGIEKEWPKTLAEDIQFVAKDSHRFQLKNITPFAWNKLYIIPPYTTDRQIMSIFGFNPKLLGCTAIYTRDDINLLVFKKNDELIAFGDFSRTIKWPDMPANNLEFITNTSWLCRRAKDENHLVLDVCSPNTKTGT